MAARSNNKPGTAKKASATGKKQRRPAAQEAQLNEAVVFIIMTAAAVLIMWLGHGPETGWLSGTLRGLNGGMSWLVSFTFFGAGLYQLITRRKDTFSSGPVIGMFCFMLCILTAAELLSVQQIRALMHFYSFPNFVYNAFTAKTGGGMLGSLAWPLYNSLGVVGSMVLLIAAAAIVIALTGRSILINGLQWLSDKKAAYDTRVQKRREEDELGEMFEQYEDFEEYETEEDYTPPKPARRKSAKSPQRSLFDIDDERRAREESFDEPVYDEPTMQPVRGRTASAPTRRRTDPITIEYPDRALTGKKPARRTPAAARSEASAEPARRTAAPISGDFPSAPARPVRSAAEEAQPVDIEHRYYDTEPEKEIPEYFPERRPARPVTVTPTQTPEITAVRRVRGTEPAPKIDGNDFAGGHVKTVHTPSVLNGGSVHGTVDTRPRAATGMPPVDIPPDEPFVPEEPAREETVPAMADRDLTIEPDAYEIPDDEQEEPAKSAKQLGTFSHRHAASDAPAPEPYNYPPLDLLKAGNPYAVEDTEDADLEKATILEETLHSFNVEASMSGIAHGPAVTRFEFTIPRGVKVSRITGLADDIAYALAAESVRIEAPIPGKTAVGVEIPNDKVESVPLRDVLESDAACNHKSKIAVCLGKDNSGRYIVADIDKLPHVLIAGQTGSGKSVCINSIIISLLYRSSPDEVKLILIDPKVVELSVYNDIPHLIAPVVTDPTKAAAALDWAVTEMSRRYKEFSKAGVRNIKGYNSHLPEGESPMPRIVIIIDELADLMMAAPGEVEDSICRLAQLARAAGMHLVIATQRPSVNVITGLIKANVPSRIAFKVASSTDSRTIYDHGGAEKLLGNGDMLYVPSGINKPLRVQGAWVSDDEVENVVEYIKDHTAGTGYDEAMMDHMNRKEKPDAEIEEELDSETDDRLEEAIEIAIDAGQTSISMLQRKMRVGYARAGRLIDEMCRRGIVSEADGSKPRNVLITKEQFYNAFKDDM